MDPFDRAVNKELVQNSSVGFYIHLAVFVGIQVMLAAIWYFTGRGMPWFLFPLFGWGVGLAAHFIAWRAGVARGRRPSV